MWGGTRAAKAAGRLVETSEVWGPKEGRGRAARWHPSRGHDRRVPVQPPLP